jgi:hypothetical protein
MITSYFPTIMIGQTWHTNVPLVYIVQCLLFMNGKGQTLTLNLDLVNIDGSLNI